MKLLKGLFAIVLISMITISCTGEKKDADATKESVEVTKSVDATSTDASTMKNHKCDENCKDGNCPMHAKKGDMKGHKCDENCTKENCPMMKMKGECKMMKMDGKKCADAKCSADCTDKNCPKCAVKKAECKAKCEAKKATTNATETINDAKEDVNTKATDAIDKVTK